MGAHFRFVTLFLGVEKTVRRREREEWASGDSKVDGGGGGTVREDKMRLFSINRQQLFDIKRAREP
jgi:hypothetical protein